MIDYWLPIMLMLGGLMTIALTELLYFVCWSSVDEDTGCMIGFGCFVAGAVAGFVELAYRTAVARCRREGSKPITHTPRTPSAYRRTAS